MNMPNVHGSEPHRGVFPRVRPSRGSSVPGSALSPSPVQKECKPETAISHSAHAVVSN